MDSDTEKPLRDHVRFTKGSNRPYVRGIDLVSSREFKRPVQAAAENHQIPEYDPREQFKGECREA